MQYFSVSPICLFPSPPLSVWNWFPVCGEFAPLLALLCRHMLWFMMPLAARSASSPSLTYWTNLHLMFFCFSLFVLQSTYLTHSVHRQLCSFNNEMPMPRKFLHAFWELLIYYWTLFFCAATVQKKFPSTAYVCCAAILCSLCDRKCKQPHQTIMHRLLSFMSKVLIEVIISHQLLMLYRGIQLKGETALQQQWAH